MSKRSEVLDNIRGATNLTLRVYEQVSMAISNHSEYNV